MRIVWTGPRDDKTARVGEYVLRCRFSPQFGGWLWMTMLWGDARISGSATTLAGAQRAAVAAMRKHQNARTK